MLTENYRFQRPIRLRDRSAKKIRNISGPASVDFNQFDSVKDAGIYQQTEGGEDNT